MKKSKPRVVIISGSTSGIGKELCRLYRERGDVVVGMARSADGDDIAVDMTDSDAVAAAVETVAARYGRIDTVIA